MIESIEINSFRCFKKLSVQRCAPINVIVGCQLFLSSHSQEWLRAFAEAAGDDVADVALWRIERTGKGPAVTLFGGSTFKAGIEHGAEVRREAGANEDVSAPSHM